MKKIIKNINHFSTILLITNIFFQRCILFVLHAELDPLGRGQLCCCALHHPDCYSGSVVRRLRSTHVCWRLPWFQEKGVYSNENLSQCSYNGNTLQPMEHPVRTNQIPRQIPEQSVYTQPIPGVIMGGVLPFGCIFIQLFFILNSIWSSQMYYMFGFLFLVFVILVITCSETTILLCYFHLCAEVIAVNKK